MADGWQLQMLIEEGGYPPGCGILKAIARNSNSSGLRPALLWYITRSGQVLP
jgi:hypothetical protein